MNSSLCNFFSKSQSTLQQIYQQLAWEWMKYSLIGDHAVPPEHGEVLGYKVFFSDVNSILRGIKSVYSPAETSVKIESLRPNRNYSFQILAFTAKGDGEISAQYFVKTRAGKMTMVKTFFNQIKRLIFLYLGMG